MKYCDAFTPNNMNWNKLGGGPRSGLGTFENHKQTNMRVLSYLWTPFQWIETGVMRFVHVSLRCIFLLWFVCILWVFVGAPLCMWMEQREFLLWVILRCEIWSEYFQRLNGTGRVCEACVLINHHRQHLLDHLSNQ